MHSRGPGQLRALTEVIQSPLGGTDLYLESMYLHQEVHVVFKGAG